MGTTFKYITDEALNTEANDGICHLCNRQASVFPFIEDVSDPTMQVDYVEEACVSCIKGVKFAFIKAKKLRGQILHFVNVQYPKGTLSGSERNERVEAILAEFLRTPQLPTFIQHDDWPWCCGDFTEYIGEPFSRSAGDLDHYAYWERGVCECPSGDRIYDLIPKESLSVLGGVSGFQCNACNRHYWTFQCT